MIAIIPARGGSKGIIGKNLRELCGMPLIYWTIDAVLKCDQVSKVFVTTDDKEISLISKKFGAEVINRPVELAQDDSMMIDVLKHAIKVLDEQNLKDESVLLLQPTSPLRNSWSIADAIRIFYESTCKSLVSIQEVPHIFNANNVFQIDQSIIQNNDLSSVGQLSRQKKKRYFARNGAAIYITSRSLITEGKILADPCVGFEMSAEDSIDIDTEFDLTLAEILLSRRISNV